MTYHTFSPLASCRVLLVVVVAVDTDIHEVDVILLLVIVGILLVVVVAVDTDIHEVGVILLLQLLSPAAVAALPVVGSVWASTVASHVRFVVSPQNALCK